MKNAIYSRNVFCLLCGVVFALATLTPDISFATTYYVAKNGNDSNSGSEISPFHSIKHGVSNLSAGDTLYVHSGTYSESILSWKTSIPNGKSWDEPITIAAYPGDKVTINPPSGTAFFWVQDGKAKYLIIDGFIVDGLYEALHGFKFSNHSSYIRVQRTEIKNTYDSPILVSICSGCADPTNYPHDTHHEFIELDVHDGGVPPSYPRNASGFYIETSYNLVRNSEFYNNAGNGGKFFHGYAIGVANQNIARNNRFFNNSQSGKWSCGLILSSGEGNVGYNNIAYGNLSGFCIAYRATGAQLYNNISYENDLYGIYVGINTTDKSRVINNTVYKNDLYGIFVGDDAKNTEVTNNIAYLNADNSSIKNIGLTNQTGTQVFHNLTSDPLFVNAGSKDFQLKQESPAIDQGYALNLISNDFAGNPRPQGSGYDIGAYEGNPVIDNTPPNIPKDVIVY